MSVNKRQHYRVFFPEAESPHLVVDGKTYRVLDVSEYGVRFVTRTAGNLSAGMVIHGALTFNDRETFVIHGTVRRIAGNEIALQLRQPIPYRKIISEQRRLLQKYPRTGT